MISSSIPKSAIKRYDDELKCYQTVYQSSVQELVNLIKDEHKLNRRFIAAFNSFAELCRTSLDARMNDEAIDEMLVQHLLTERLFRTIFNNPDFVNNNAIAAEIEKVVRALASRSFNRNEFLQKLDRFYVAIERAAKGIENWSERQEFLNTVYERFFQGFSIKKADTYGIVYTPQEIVDFMVASVDEILKREFGKSIETPGVKILDPATGTGNFIVNIIRHITSRGTLQEKYTKDLFCNEIMLLPYYIASLNIEHEYYEKMKQYEPFEGICFADTLELAEEQQLSLFVEENTERVKREKEADITVVIGNPPYNVGQINENDNNKNRKYPRIDNRIRETYVKDSKATNRNALSDVYVKFFRWATDRLQGRDGIVCLVTNNSFIDQIAFDGMRKYLQKDFTQIYHLDLHGNVRKNPKLSGTTHNVFGIQVGVGITLAVRSSHHADQKIYYYRLTENWRKTDKLAFLTEKTSIANIDWLELSPDSNNNWLTDGLHPSFKSYIPIGSKDTRAAHSLASNRTEIEAIFKAYSPGAQTSRDDWVYDFAKETLQQKVMRFIETYNSEVDRWKRTPEPKNVDTFVLYDDTKIKWSRDLKADLKRGRYAAFSVKKLRQALYRPFTVKNYFFDPILSQDIFLLPRYFPTLASEGENCSIVLTNLGAEKPFMVIAANRIPDYHLVGAGAVSLCFPFYIYSEDGSNRHENITDWALKQFQDQYGHQITKWDIFHYVYALLHHPQYRELYKENLKRDLPRIPLLQREEAFWACVSVGKQLIDMHVNYEQAEEYPLKEADNGELSYAQSRRVDKKMKLSADKTAVIVNKTLTLEGIPQQCFEYRLGNRSALEWVIDQYQFSTDKRSGIESDPHRLADPEYIIRLLKQVIMLSVKTAELVKELTEAVTVSDWLDETVH